MTHPAYIPAALRRALLRTQKAGLDPTSREGSENVLRELFDNEGVYLKELNGRRTAGRSRRRAVKAATE